MPLVCEMRHPRGLSFDQERKVVMLRTIKKLPWDDIRLQVKNLEGKHPCRQMVIDTFKSFCSKRGRRKVNYKNCGRKVYKATPEIRKFVVRKLLQLRSKCICTSAVLQHCLAAEKGVELTAPYIRKILRQAGYRWLPRNQKPKYDKDTKAARLECATEVTAMTEDQIEEYFTLCMDGVVLSTPPTKPVHRDNYCRIGETHVYRKASEAASEELGGGGGKYGNQVPLDRAVPMWGGIGKGGAAVVLFHPKRKISSADWVTQAVDSGNLVRACKKA
jgi:hypothetical protein